MSLAEVSKLRAMFNKEKKQFIPMGDNHLSANDCYHWSLCYHVLGKYGVPILFKYHHGYPKHRVDARMEWFIPQGSKFEAVKQYLYYELRREIREGKEFPVGDTTEYMPGLSIHFMPFSGVTPYLERDISEKMVRKFISNMNGRMLKDVVTHEFDQKHFKRGWMFGSIATILLMSVVLWARL